MTNLTTTLDEMFMLQAIELAELGARHGLRPFGCVIVNEHGHAIATAYGTESPLDPTRHSEILAIKLACKLRSPGAYLRGCTLYSTHEPCCMCCGAINHAKLSVVVFGSYRTDLPELFRRRHRTIADILADTSHPPEIRGGILRDECVALFDRELPVVVAATPGGVADHHQYEADDEQDQAERVEDRDPH